MKKRIFSFALALLLLTGCGSPAAQEIEPSVEEQISTEPQVQTSEKTTEPEAAIPEKVEASQGETSLEQKEEEQPPADVKAWLYLPNDDYSGLIKEPVTWDVTNVRFLVMMLVQRGVLPEDTGIRAVNIRDTSAVESMEGEHTKYVVGERWLELDMTGQFMKAFTEVSEQKEELIIASLTNTVLDFFDMEEMTLLCRGEIVETSHRIYDDILPFRVID